MPKYKLLSNFSDCIEITALDLEHAIIKCQNYCDQSKKWTVIRAPDTVETIRKPGVTSTGNF